MNKFVLTLNYVTIDLLSELARREKEAGIFPEAELDLFMKVISSIFQIIIFIHITLILII